MLIVVDGDGTLLYEAAGLAVGGDDVGVSLGGGLGGMEDPCIRLAVRGGR